MLLGSQVPLKGEKMLLGSVEKSIENDATALMVYTGSPQNTKRKPLEAYQIESAHQLLDNAGINKSNIIVHAPYIVNLANDSKRSVYEYSINFLREEIKRTERIGANQLVLHPGSHVGLGIEHGLRSITNGLNRVLEEKSNVQICLEAMSGKGTECGSRFEELAQIIEGVQESNRITICLDTCHLHDAGYDVKEDF